MKYLLDTNICIHFMKGEYQIDKKIQEVGVENCFISEITVLELIFGVENSEKKDKNRRKLDVFLGFLNENIVPIKSCFELYAKEKSRLKKDGRLIAEFDMLIGCSAIANDLNLVTRNTKHFRNLAEIKIENWVD